MIELEVEDYCHNCPMFEPCSVNNSFFSDASLIIVQINVKCKNEAKCYQLIKYLKTVMEKGEIK